MGLAWQQGPLAPGAEGTFLVAQPLPERLLYAEPLRRRLRVQYGGTWIAQSDNVVILHEPGRYPVAYFPRADLADGVLRDTDRTTHHPELGRTAWYAVRHGDHEAARGAWEHTELPAFAGILAGRIAFAWHAMDAFYESGFAPRWYVPREDIDEQRLTPVTRQTFCPYKGLCDYYDIGDAHRAAWSYREAYREVDPIDDLISFEPDKVTVTIDGQQLRLAPGQQVVPHGPDRGLTPGEAMTPVVP
jgi:uncharacterized protein (DUF427 family)